MGIVYRYQKGEPLTIEEMDGNFKSIEERIEKLEITPFLGEGISKINQEGDRLSFLGTFGTALGCVTLPKAFPVPRGKWQPETAYRLLDWAQMERCVYSCVKPHTSTQFKNDLENWVLVFEV